MGGVCAENNESDTTQSPPLWTQTQGKNQTELGLCERVGPDDSAPKMMHEINYGSPVSGSLTPYGFHWPFIDQNTDNADRLTKHVLDQSQRSNFFTFSQSMSHPSFNMMDYSMRHPAPAVEHVNRLLPLLPPTCIEDSPSPSQMKPQPLFLQKEETKSKGLGSCKLFGISLIGSRLATDTATPHENIMLRPEGQIVSPLDQLQDLVSDPGLQKAVCQMSTERSIKDDERTRSLQASEQLSRNVRDRLQRSSTRSFIKVFSF